MIEPERTRTKDTKRQRHFFCGANQALIMSDNGETMTTAAAETPVDDRNQNSDVLVVMIPERHLTLTTPLVVTTSSSTTLSTKTRLPPRQMRTTPPTTWIWSSSPIVAIIANTERMRIHHSETQYLPAPACHPLPVCLPPVLPANCFLFFLALAREPRVTTPGTNPRKMRVGRLRGGPDTFQKIQAERSLVSTIR